MGHDHDKVVPGLICEKDLCKIREAVCIQVDKIFDSCKEKDCIEDAKVIFKNSECIRKIINEAINVKARKAEVLDVFADIEEVPFKRGFYTVDVKYFIKVTLDFFIPNGLGPNGTRIVEKTGLVVFDKKVILFGSEGNVKIFKSHFVENGVDTPIRSNLQQDNLPVSKVEVAEPIALNAKIEDIHDKLFEETTCKVEQMPRHIADALGHDDDDDDPGNNNLQTRRVVVTLGIFTIIKLTRLVQLLIPAFDFCVPHKQCIASTNDDPCEIFETIEFPVDEFFPPQIFDFPGALETEKVMQQEMHGHNEHT
jgi:hypothetical protein